MKKKLFYVLLLSIFIAGHTQSIKDSFFSKVDYIGAFGTTDWTAPWANWDPVNTNYPDPTVTKGNGEFSRSAGTHITSDETWSGVIELDGWVYVDAGATLTINPGTIIRGNNKSVLVIERGGKIMAEGTAANPIVMTSNQPAGLRAQSDWAGLVICGKAPNNLDGGEGIAEGGIESTYGGSNPHDNSGVIKYLRIEFPGFEIATGSEVNGLTFCSVGDSTVVDYVQVSYSGDDAYEWFGGTVNVKHLISFKTEDDDFDTDNGFIGHVQFGVAQRDSSIVDTDAANGFESDNDAAGSSKVPKTHAIFSNMSLFGPSVTNSDPAVLRPKYAEGSCMRLRRNTRLQIYNSVFAGYGRGVRIESDGSLNSGINDDSLTIQNSIVAGVRGVYFQTDASAGLSAEKSWFLKPIYNNDTLALATDLQITDPFNYTAPNFLPKANAPVLTASYWYKPFVAENDIDNAFFERVNYIGALGQDENWTDGWTNWDPVNTEYPEPTVTKGNGEFSHDAGTHITSDETWSGVIELDGWVYVDAGATLTIDAGTIIRGNNKAVLVIERGGKIMAEGTAENPIVMTSNQPAGLRAQSDWAGLVLCGKAVNNLDGGEGVAEGGIGSVYGGSDSHDNSGTIEYLRIEFPGFEIATGSEVNGLTFCSVGDGTTINHVQVSYSGDDGYEWFGGSVNAKHLISYKTEDDDFDTDNGFNGMVQFCIAARDSSIVDTDAANAFESDNDAAGSNNNPKTHAIFSNVSAFGPAVSATSPAVLRAKHAEGSAMRLRRNTRLEIYNSIFAGWGRGVRIESEGSYHSMTTDDSLRVRNSMISGIRGVYFQTDASAGVSGVRTWFMKSEYSNDTLADNTDLMITDPFNYTARNFVPMNDSPVLCASSWSDGVCATAVGDYTTNNNSAIAYPNPFSTVTNIDLYLAAESFVSITISDLTGRVVATLEKGNVSEGISTYEFNSSEVGSGMYLATIVVNNKVQTIKLMAR